MTAKEMFEDLGYKVISEWFGGVEYQKKSTTISGEYWKNKIVIDKSCGIYSDKYFGININKAIQKQIEELEWEKNDN